MKCSLVAGWLLSAKAGADVPDDVRRHLGHCERCRRLGEQLGELDQALQRWPVPPSNPAACPGFWEKLGELEPASATFATGKRPVRRRGRTLLLALSGALAALLVVGVALSWRGRSPHAAVPAPELATPLGTGGRGPVLEERALQANLRLAESLTPGEQFRVLADLAGELHREALRAAEQEAADRLPLVAAMYGQVLERGLMGRAYVLSPLKKRELLGPLLARLRQAERDCREAERRVSAAQAVHLQAMASATRKLCDELGLVPGRVAEPARADPPLLEALVVQSVRLAEEPDPLRRAQCCAEVADELVENILAASEEEDAERAAGLGQCLGAVMERGVGGNLARALEGEMTDDRLGEWERVRARARGAEAALQKQLEQAAPPQRAGLERALEASRPGRQHVPEPGQPQGKGPPWLRGPESRPPGLRGKLPPGLGRKLRAAEEPR